MAKWAQSNQPESGTASPSATHGPADFRRRECQHPDGDSRYYCEPRVPQPGGERHWAQRARPGGGIKTHAEGHPRPRFSDSVGRRSSADRLPGGGQHRPHHQSFRSARGGSHAHPCPSGFNLGLANLALRGSNAREQIAGEEGRLDLPRGAPRRRQSVSFFPCCSTKCGTTARAPPAQGATLPCAR